MTCPNCGEKLIGDGYRWPRHCPNAPEEAWWYAEPDMQAILCPEIHVSIWKTGEARNEVLLAPSTDR
jgi:hypothetical protein